jgi:ATP-dependent protease HslVU (ClpYQ) peptidase subunit
VGTETRDLENQSTIIFQEVVHLTEELTVTADTDVLSHLEGNNLVVLGAGGNFTMIAAENAGLVRRYL